MRQAARILLVTGDDFGASPLVNAAILRSFREGVLTGASLMANGEAFQEAVEIARAHPDLDVGVHLALARGRPVVPPQDLPFLVNNEGQLPENPVEAGFRFFFDRRMAADLEREIDAQIRKVIDAGLRPTYLDGHLHLHIHPTVLPIVVRMAKIHGIPAIRLPREDLSPALRLDPRDRHQKILHTLIYRGLCAHALPRLRSAGLQSPDRFYGLLSCGRMTEDLLLGMIDGLPPGVTEIGFHPALGLPPELAPWAPDYAYREEFSALVSPRVRQRIDSENIQLGSYRLLGRSPCSAAVSRG